MFVIYYDGDYVRLPNGEIMEFNYKLWVVTHMSLMRFHPDVTMVVLL